MPVRPSRAQKIGEWTHVYKSQQFHGEEGGGVTKQDLLPIEPELKELVTYDPRQGLKTIVVAESAEKHAKRAKDATKLIKAVRAKLEEQHKFINWWDVQEKQQGARKTRRDGPVMPLADVFDIKASNTEALTKALANIRQMLSRWRKNLKEPADLEQEVERVENKCIALCEYDPSAKDHAKSIFTGENEWFTPPEYIEAARKVLGDIDLDPASSDEAQKVVKAIKYFTKYDDGLKQEWYGRIWLNPPYAQPLIANFVSRLCVEHAAGRATEAILLTHNYTDTAWFHEIGAAASAICFTRGRVKFYEGDKIAAPTQGQAFSYFGGEVNKFSDVFHEIGFIVFTG